MPDGADGTEQRTDDRAAAAAQRPRTDTRKDLYPDIDDGGGVIKVDGVPGQGFAPMVGSNPPQHDTAPPAGEYRQPELFESPPTPAGPGAVPTGGPIPPPPIPVLPGEDDSDGLHPGAGPQALDGPQTLDSPPVATQVGDQQDPPPHPAAPPPAPKAAAADTQTQSSPTSAVAGWWARLRTQVSVDGAWSTIRSWPIIVQVLLALLIVWLVLTVLTKVFFAAPAVEDSATAPGAPGTTIGEPGTEQAQPKDGPLVPESVEASCGPGSSQASLAFSGQKRDAWVCVRSLGIDSVSMKILFRQPVVVTKVRIVPGWNWKEASGIDRWTQHRVVTRVLWQFGSGAYRQSLAQNFVPSRAGVEMAVDNIATQEITLVIQETQPPKADQNKDPLDGMLGRNRNPNKRDDFAVSSIEIIGHLA